ncbi:hypothetical protein CI109_102012 [Kwoniella shandongensis]|uniref:Uncharacterized protein n=1 Tax=Kwoniella shandongensis TaxID=1734106 RepID=A0A5M6BSU5_9TREE|nr:uncharacterized protein CI109_006552 [Kwoniella shandongensis]KAA5525090.1 hypothetical protein CI109_006552 [Kwoniella shandongensis]
MSPAPARASTRISITWSDRPPLEDTDTLVLTIEGYSLDLRVFVDGPQNGEIDWSTVARVDEVEGSTEANPTLRWTHLIDNRPPSSLPDQGKFRTLPNGDVVEEGIMFNPKTDKNEPYEEVWRRLSQSPQAPYLVLESISVPSGGSHEESNEQGVFLGRVGENALGIAKLQPQGTFVAWRDRLGDGSSTWKRVYEFGEKQLVEKVLPSLPEQTPDDWVVGKEVELGGQKWVVRAVGTL